MQGTPDERCEMGEGKTFFCGKSAVDDACDGCPFFLGREYWTQAGEDMIGFAEDLAKELWNRSVDEKQAAEEAREAAEIEAFERKRREERSEG